MESEPSPEWSHVLPVIYLIAIASAASAAGRNQAQSLRKQTATAATRQPARKPTSRRNDCLRRSALTSFNARRLFDASISDRTALVKLPVMTAVETTFGSARRSVA